MEFKDTLKGLRVAKHISQAELAKKLNISPAAIGMYESGKRTPNKETLEIIADFFNVDVPYLLGYETKSTYLLDPKDMILQKAFEERPEMRMLFSVAEDATAEDIQKAIDIIKIMKGNNNG